MEKVQYSITVQVAKGPVIQSGGTLEVDAYEKIDIEIAAGATEEATISAGALADVRALVIKPSVEDKTISVKTSAAGAAAIALDGPITLIGAAAASLIGTAPDKFTFKNTGAAPASVQVLVGRKAVA